MIKHGHAGYTQHGCRCDICREANRKYQLQRNHARKAHVEKYGLPNNVQHNSSAYKNWGCRCETCRADWAQKQRDYQKRRKASAP